MKLQKITYHIPLNQNSSAGKTARILRKHRHLNLNVKTGAPISRCHPRFRRLGLTLRERRWHPAMDQKTLRARQSESYVTSYTIGSEWKMVDVSMMEDGECNRK